MASLTPALRPGSFLDHFFIEEMVAVSGMGSIFRATDMLTNQRVAIKIPHSRSRFGQFFQKRQPVGGVRLDFNHPGIVRKLAESHSQHHYTVMEWVDGRSLRQILDGGALHADRAIGIAQRICVPLGYIHGQGALHLDLKPENVMIGANDRIKLIDVDVNFAHQTGAGFLSFSKPEIMGTPDYASPEQIQGKRCDARSDIYALGMMLYEMLTGELPFTGAEPSMALQLKVNIDPPSPRDINSEIVPELDSLISKAISRPPEERPASAARMAEALAELNSARVAAFAGSI